MYWHFDRIPKGQGERILDLYADKDYKKIATLFIHWGVIPGGCDGCGVWSLVHGFMEYAIDQNLIIMNDHDKIKELKTSREVAETKLEHYKKVIELIDEEIAKVEVKQSNEDESQN